MTDVACKQQPSWPADFGIQPPPPTVIYPGPPLVIVGANDTNDSTGRERELIVVLSLKDVKGTAEERVHLVHTVSGPPPHGHSDMSRHRLRATSSFAIWSAGRERGVSLRRTVYSTYCGKVMAVGLPFMAVGLPFRRAA